MLRLLGQRVGCSPLWRGMRTRFFTIKRLLLLLFLMALDFRDLYYKLIWQGPADSFSFTTGSVSILESAPVVSLVTDQVRRDGFAASGWSSFLSQCDELYPFVGEGSKFFLAVKAINCKVTHRGQSTVIPQLVITSNMRADSMAWAACSLLYLSRRPRICGDALVSKFTRRYEFDEISVDASMMAPIGSLAEAELLRLLDLIGLSYPLYKIVCVEGFSLESDQQRGIFTPHLYACASPNLNRVEFVGVETASFQHLQKTKAWLTDDVLAILNWRFSIRQNCASRYEIADVTATDDAGNKRSTISFRAISATNFSSHGLLFGLVILIDMVLLRSHFKSLAEIVKWMALPQYYTFQLWIHRFGDSYDEKMEAMPPLPGHCEEKRPFDEREVYAFFAQSVYRTWSYRLMLVTTRVLSWLVIMPNSVIWTWSDSQNMKFQAYLCSIKSWVLVASAFSWLWRGLVWLHEPLAYYVSRRTHVTNQEIIAIASLVALWQRDRTFTICEQKWRLERQRVNDLDSFQGGYLAHSNTFNPSVEQSTTTPLHVAWIIYAPLVRIIWWSVAMIFVWLVAKLCLSVLKKAVLGANESDQILTKPYARLELESAIESPIRALSIVRYQLSMEIVKDGKLYIRPSCYLEYGVMLKTAEYRKIVHVGDIFQRRPMSEQL